MRGTPHIRARGSPTTRGMRENAPEYDGHRRAGGILSPECGTSRVPQNGLSSGHYPLLASVSLGTWLPPT